MSSVKLREEKDCLNCGHIVEERFCPHCGQENIIVKEKAWAMVTHAIADYFHFEHKFFSTMRPLLLQPGQLTKEYVAGKRMSFIHPIRLYIFISIIFFIVILGGAKLNSDKKEKKEIEMAQLDSLDKRQLKKALTYIPDGALDKELLEKKIDSAQKVKSKRRKDTSSYYKFNPKWVTAADSTYEIYAARVGKLPKDQQPGMFAMYLAKNQIKFRGADGQKKFVEGLLHNIPKMMFLLLPLFAAMLHLFYIRKRKYYYEDLIYAFHLHSCIFLSILLVKLVNLIFSYVIDISGITVSFLTFYLVWYVYRSLRTFYGSSRWKTVLKMFLLFIGYNFLLVITVMITAAITVMLQ